MRFLISTRPPGVAPNTIPIADFYNEVGCQLVEMGHEVLLLYDVRPPNNQEQEWLQSVGLRWISWVSGRQPRKLKDLLFLTRLLREFQPDCVCFQFSSVPWGMVSSWLLKIPHRLVWYQTAHQANIGNNKILAWREKARLVRGQLYRNLATHHVVVSQVIKQEYLDLFHVSDNEVTVQYQGVYLPKGSTKPRYKNTLVCVSGLSIMKGQDVLIRALPKLVAEFGTLKLILAGPGDPKPFLDLASQLGVIQNCEFLGSVTREQVYDLFQTCTIAVLPTLADAAPKVAMEAMACGAPLIASAIGGVLDIVENGKSAVLVAPGNVDAWIVAISQLFCDEVRQKQLSKQGRERASFFALEERAKAHASWLEELASS